MKITRPPFLPREFRGYSLNAACRLEASCPGFLLRLLDASASDLIRQAFFAVAAEVDLDKPEVFLAQIAERAPDVMVGLEHHDPYAQIARALILLKPRRVIEVLFGSCPDGLAGAFSRFGGSPLYGPDTYRLAFDLFSDPARRHRAKVLGQLEGKLRPEHVTVAAGLDDVLVHRNVIERAKPAEIPALNSFVQMIVDLCGATPDLIRESLDALPVAGRGARITEWAQGWVARQVRLPFDPPIPASDPDLKLRLGADLVSLGRRFRNCAGHRMGHSFFEQRLIYEWAREGEQAVIELLRLTSDSEVRWLAEGALGPRNRRLEPAMAAAIQAALDRYGILYEPMTPLSANEEALHNLIDHSTRPAWDEHLDNVGGEPVHEHADIDHMLAGLEQEVHGLESA